MEQNRPGGGGLRVGRGGLIRTDDPLLPKQMRYQAALRPDRGDARVSRQKRWAWQARELSI